MKNKSKKLIKPLTKQEIQERYNLAHNFQGHPDFVYKELGEKLPLMTNEEKKDKNNQLINKGGYLNSFEKSHIFIAECFSGNLQLGVIEFINNLIEEYNCKTTLERSLCENIGLNYGKKIQLTKKFNLVMNSGEYLNNDRTRYLNMIGKELDKANRNYLYSLNNLIEIKRPQVNLNIKTKNAFIASNQQFNNNLNKNEKIIKN